jgi:hypothetical protein
MGSSGGGDSTQFKAQGAPPGFDYSTAMGLQQLAVGGDIQGYALSDQDFANRYPALQSAYNQYQAMLNQQVPGVAGAQAGTGQIMQGLGGNILGRLGTDTTSDINALRGQAGTVASAAQPLFNIGATQAGMGQPIYNLGQAQAGYAQLISQLGASQAGLAQPLVNLGGQISGIGGQINRMGGQMAGMAATPYAVGQQLLQEPIDPQTQQQMMRAGLTSAAGSLGAASLGQGMAGQAAAARQLGLNTLQYGQAMRGEAMQDIGQAASILGQAGQLRGLGGQTMGLGGQTMGLGGQQLTAGGQLYGLGAGQLGAGAQTMGLGSAVLGQGAQTYGLGANAAAQAGGLYGSAQNMQEQMGMNTAQMAGIYGGLQAQQANQFTQNMANAYNMFQKRPFGLGGANLAQSELGQAGAYNSFQQANYATMNGIAFNQAQMAAQQQQLGAQQSAGMMSAGVGAAGAVASASAAAAAITCWVARECLGTADSRWKAFRLWLLNFAPRFLRSIYLRHGQAFAAFVSTQPLLKKSIRVLMLGVLRTQKRRTRLLALNLLFS